MNKVSNEHLYTSCRYTMIYIIENHRLYVGPQNSLASKHLWTTSSQESGLKSAISTPAPGSAGASSATVLSVLVLRLPRLRKLCRCHWGVPSFDSNTSSSFAVARWLGALRPRLLTPKAPWKSSTIFSISRACCRNRTLSVLTASERFNSNSNKRVAAFSNSSSPGMATIRASTKISAKASNCSGAQQPGPFTPSCSALITTTSMAATRESIKSWRSERRLAKAASATAKPSSRPTSMASKIASWWGEMS